MPRDETRVAGILEGLCIQLNQTRDERSLTRLRQGLPLVLDPDVRLRIVELDDELAGLPLVSERSRQLLDGAPLSFALNSEHIRITGDRAQVDVDLLVTVSGSGEQRRDLRRTRVALRKQSDVWRIERVEIEPVAPSEPEPRP